MARYGSGNDETIITEYPNANLENGIKQKNLDTVLDIMDEYVELRETVEKNDLISRKQALELFTFNRLGDRIPEKDCDGFDVTIAVKDIKRMIRNLPTACEKEEQGVLMKLPCKVGDTLYRIDTDERMENIEIEPFIIEYIVICENEDVLFKYDAYDGVICHLENIITDKPYLDYYRVFLTKEEAKQKLAELKGNRKNE